MVKLAYRILVNCFLRLLSVESLEDARVNWALNSFAEGLSLVQCLSLTVLCEAFVSRCMVFDRYRETVRLLLMYDSQFLRLHSLTRVDLFV